MPVTDPPTALPDGLRAPSVEATEKELGLRATLSRYLRSDLARPSQAGIVTALTLLALLSLRNRGLLFAHVWEDGDYAVNSILIDKARHFELLVGNYSRFGFNHPGPALLYVQAWSQLLFRDAIPVFASPFGAQLFGVIVLNAVLCGLCASIVVRRTGRVLAALVLVSCVLIYAWLNPGLLASTWMPDVYLCPFLLLLLSAASVATLELRDTWKLVLACGLLVHGHVSFVFFTVGVVSVVLCSLWVQRAALSSSSIRRSLKQCAAVASVLALPIVVNTVLNYPGEIGAYWRYSRSNQAGGHSAQAALTFVGDYWSHGRAGHLLAISLLIAAALAAWTYRSRGRRFLVSIMAFVLLASILTTVYAMVGVDDLSLTYIARFYNTAPILTLFTIGVAGLEVTARTRARHLILAATTVVLIFLAMRPGLEDSYRGAPWVPKAVDSLSALQSEPVKLDFALGFWPAAAGLVEESRRRGDEICVYRRAPIYATLFTNGLMCPINRAKEGTTIEVVGPSGSNRRVIYEGPGFALTLKRPSG